MKRRRLPTPNVEWPPPADEPEVALFNIPRSRAGGTNVVDVNSASRLAIRTKPVAPPLIEAPVEPVEPDETSAPIEAAQPVEAATVPLNSLAAAQLARLAGDATLFTALGDDELGRRARSELERLGVRVRAPMLGEPTRRAFVYVDEDGERTITVLGNKLVPHEANPAYPWHELGGADAESVALEHRRVRRVMVEVNAAADRLAAVVGVLPAMRQATVAPLFGEVGFAVKAAVPRDSLPRVIPALKAGFIVLSDRYIYTAMARAGVRGVDRFPVAMMQNCALAAVPLSVVTVHVFVLLSKTASLTRVLYSMSRRRSKRSAC